MPMYEYGCSSCAGHFDRLCRMDEADSSLRCPHCGSEQVQRKLSLFASVNRDAPAAGPPVAMSSGGCCSGGGCACAAKN